MEVWEEPVTKAMTRLLVLLNTGFQRNDESASPARNILQDACIVSFKIAYPDNDFRLDLGFVVGIVAMRARRTVLTDSGVVKTLAMSGSSTTTTWR